MPRPKTHKTIALVVSVKVPVETKQSVVKAAIRQGLSSTFDKVSVTPVREAE
jgi:hypothetical protein